MAIGVTVVTMVAGDHAVAAVQESAERREFNDDFYLDAREYLEDSLDMNLGFSYSNPTLKMLRVEDSSYNVNALMIS